MNTIRDHLNEVRENIQKACEKAGRSPQEDSSLMTEAQSSQARGQARITV